MPDDRRSRFALPKLSYTSKVHLQRRLKSIDYTFLGAIAATAAAVTVAVRMLG